MNVLPEFVLPMILWRWVCQNHVFHSMFAPLQTKSNLILHMFLVSNAKSEQSTSIYTVFWPSKNKISAVFCQTCTQTISQIAEFPPIRSPLFAVHGHSAGLKIWQDATERHPLLHLPYLLRFTPFKSFPSCLWFGKFRKILCCSGRVCCTASRLKCFPAVSPASGQSEHIF